ncbi:LOW QUALITY PROTEIN: uncharacterized protein O9250_003630 [Rhynochetos jubatus]
MKAKLENEGPFVKNLISDAEPEQQAAERTLTAETEKLKNKGQERQITERWLVLLVLKMIEERWRDSDLGNICLQLCPQYIPSLQKSRKKTKINCLDFQTQQKWTVFEDGSLQRGYGVF